MPNEFDVFLSHNSQDKPIVQEIAVRLKAQGVRVWLDRNELRPGLPWQEGLEKGIQASKSVAVFIGKHNLGAWQQPEMRVFIDRSRREQFPVIPVLLPDCPESSELTLFLQAFTWVDLRGGITDEGLDLLEWGITGTKPDGAPPLGRTPISLEGSAGEGPRKPRPKTGHAGNRSFPWNAWSLGTAIVGVLVAVGAWLWSVPIQPKRPDLYEVRVQLLDYEGHPVSEGKVRTSTGNEPHLLPDGWWEIQIPTAKVPHDGKVTIWAEHDDWESNQANLVLADDRNVQARIQLKPPRSTIRGRVADDENRALAGATITSQDGTPGTASSDVDGSFALDLPVAREKRVGLRAELKGWTPDTTYCYTGRDGCQVVLTKP